MYVCKTNFKLTDYIKLNNLIKFQQCRIELEFEARQSNYTVLDLNICPQIS